MRSQEGDRPQLVSRGRRAQLVRANRSAVTQRRQLNRRTEEEASQQQVSSWIDRPSSSTLSCREEPLLPGFVLFMCSSHRLWLCGGAVFCSICGATATSDRAGRLNSPCEGRLAQGSRGWLLRLLSGRLPWQLQQWPDSLARPDAHRVVASVRSFAGGFRATPDDLLAGQEATALQEAGTERRGNPPRPSP